MRVVALPALVLLALSATPAAATPITDLAFTPSTWAGGVTSDWVFRFVPHGDFDNLAVQFPPGTNAVVGGDARLSTYSGGTSLSFPVSSISAGTIRFHFSLVHAPEGVSFRMSNVVNPPAGSDGAAITLGIANGDDTPGQPPHFDPVHPTGPGGPDSSDLGRGAGGGRFTAAAPGRVTMTASSRQTGAIADWTYDFTPSEAIGTDHTITLWGHSGTVFPPVAYDYLVNGADTVPVVDPSGRQVTLTVPRNFGRVPIQVFVHNLQNPTFAGLHGNTAYGLLTSSISGHRSDLPTARAPNIAFAANPAPTAVDDLVAIGQGTGGTSGTLGALVVKFFTSGSNGRMLRDGTEIRISSKDQICSPQLGGCGAYWSWSGQQVNTTPCITVINATTGARGRVCGDLDSTDPSNTSPVFTSGKSTLVVRSPVAAFPGDEIVIGTQAYGAQDGTTTLSVSTSRDPHQVSTDVGPWPG